MVGGPFIALNPRRPRCTAPIAPAVVTALFMIANRSTLLNQGRQRQLHPVPFSIEFKQKLVSFPNIRTREEKNKLHVERENPVTILFWNKGHDSVRRIQ